MSLEQIALAFAAVSSGVASGAMYELVGARWAAGWTLVMVVMLVALYVF